ncbi:MAG: carbamoyltransferase [Rhodospirillales bacterium]|nr:carbamoyltransferase [Rhodospirillales bacterium]
MIVLGLSAFYHDSAAALVRDGEIVAAAQEERFTRKKNDSDLPVHAAAYCLDAAGISLDEVDHIAFYDKPLLTFDRLLETYLAYAPSGFGSFAKAIPVWVKDKLLQKSRIAKGLSELDRGTVTEDDILFGYHHHSHAAAAFYPSPFNEAAIVIMDGVGEWATTSIGYGKGREIRLDREVRFPHSLGMLYSAFTYYLGFKVNDGEYKVMGLAPYGEPVYADLIMEKLLDVKDDGSFRMNMSYFNYTTGLTMTNDKFAKLFGEPRRDAADPLTDFHMNVARSVQAVAEKLIMGVCAEAHRMTGAKNLCLAGGVALNCVANGLIQREGPFENIWIQPASGDAGSALGIALAAANLLGDERVPARSNGHDAMQGGYLGPAYGDDEIRAVLDSYGAVYDRLEDDALISTVSDALAADEIVGWFQGRMEFGPRALGNRSILGNPASPSMQKTLNMKIKYRESFRPFAPAVLKEDAAEHFQFDGESPYMLIVAPVREEDRTELSDDDKARVGLDRLNVVRAKLPAITHVDYSARIQTVTPDSNKRFYDLISAFKQRTGNGVLVNTSFNVRDEPVVCSPEDAYRCFMATEMDMLALGNFVLRKAAQ